VKRDGGRKPRSVAEVGRHSSYKHGGGDKSEEKKSVGIYLRGRMGVRSFEVLLEGAVERKKAEKTVRSPFEGGSTEKRT